MENAVLRRVLLIASSAAIVLGLSYLLGVLLEAPVSRHQLAQVKVHLSVPFLDVRNQLSTCDAGPFLIRWVVKIPLQEVR